MPEKQKDLWAPKVMPEAMVSQIQEGYEDYLEAEEARQAELESPANVDADKSEVGMVRRSAFQYISFGGARTDGAAIRITQGGIVPIAIWGWDGNTLPTKPAMTAKKGNVLCFSGAISGNVSCGPVVARSRRYTGITEIYAVGGYWVKFREDKRPGKGDSGAPVCNQRTGRSVGLISAGRPYGSFEETLVAPLIHPRFARPGEMPGILHGPSMEPIQLKLGE